MDAMNATGETPWPSGYVAEVELHGFDEFYVATRPAMIRLAVLLTGSPTAAEEVTQDAFITVLDRWARIDDPPAYLRRCVVNRCTSWHRRRFLIRRQAHLVASPDEHHDRYDEFADALAKLTARRRAVIVLRFYEGLSIADIASTLQISQGTAKSTLHRGLAQLKESLQ
jgi:RNA polymerase sigma-70 factor (sigma-E family)